jgi:hypothetical protein
MGKTKKKCIDNVDHLTKSAKEALLFSDEERIERIQRSRWIGYTAAEQTIDKLERLLKHPRTDRMPNLLIISDTNNGKTTIVKRFASLHPLNPNIDGDAIILPVLLVEAPPVPDETNLHNAILEELNSPHKKREHPDQKRAQVITISKQIGLRMLIIDEFHNLIAGNSARQRNFRNAIKYLGNKLKMPIVGVGTPEARAAIQTDEQLTNRFTPVILPRWKMGEEFLRLLASFEAMLPLYLPSNLTNTTTALRLLSMSDGLIGEISTILTNAAVAAIETGQEKIVPKLLDSIDYIPPPKRKGG